MATQTIRMPSVSGTDSLKLYNLSTGALVASAAAAVALDDPATFAASFTDVPAGDYRLISFVGSIPVRAAGVTLTLTTGTFRAWDDQPPGAATFDATTQAQVDRIEAAIGALDGSLGAYTGPVKSGGTIVLKNGDSYTTAAGSAISLPISDAGGVLFAKLDGNESSLAFGAGRGSTRDEITGTISAVSYASDVTTITIEITGAVDAQAGVDYGYDIQRDTGSGDVTDVTGCLEVDPDYRS